MYAFRALVAVLAVAAVGYWGGTISELRPLFGIVVPYAAIALFLIGLSRRVIRWASSPVPFRIPTTCGQQRSLPFLKHSRLESPFTALEVVGRMALEILLFRSLFRNTRAELRPPGRLLHSEAKFLWLGALAFHYSFLVIFLRHLRFFLDPVPACVMWLQNLDGFFQLGVPVLYITDVVILVALSFLLGRRLFDARVRYLSLASDYFALFLVGAIALSGVWMRYFSKVYIPGIKQLAMGLVTFTPTVPASVDPLFFMHLTLVSVLLAWFPFSKLCHMAGVFLSPTRNLANNNRAVRHINPWNYPVKVHTYEEWEEEFRDKIVAAGLPLDRE